MRILSEAIMIALLSAIALRGRNVLAGPENDEPVVQSGAQEGIILKVYKDRESPHSKTMAKTRAPKIIEIDVAKVLSFQKPCNLVTKRMLG